MRHAALAALLTALATGVTTGEAAAQAGGFDDAYRTYADLQRKAEASMRDAETMSRTGAAGPETDGCRIAARALADYRTALQAGQSLPPIGTSTRFIEMSVAAEVSRIEREKSRADRMAKQMCRAA
jgi:hypothetical protein